MVKSRSSRTQQSQSLKVQIDPWRSVDQYQTNIHGDISVYGDEDQINILNVCPPSQDASPAKLNLLGIDNNNPYFFSGSLESREVSVKPTLLHR